MRFVTFDELRSERAARKQLYAEFLRSDMWRAAARRVREKANNLCVLCRRVENLEVHHITYAFPNRPEADGKWPHGWLPVGDAGLVALCSDCHKLLHPFVHG